MSEENTQEYTSVDYLHESADFLRTLGSLLYKELSSDQIEALAQYDFLAMKEEAESELLAEGFGGLGLYLRRKGTNVRQDLAVEYASIFLGAGVIKGLSAIPYESIFTSDEGLIMQDARDEVLRIYASNGFGIDPELNDAEDHLAFMLEFLAGMADKTADALLADSEEAPAMIQTQIDFINNHIMNWIDELMEQVEKFATSVFYTSVMKIVKGYLIEHKAILADIAE